MNFQLGLIGYPLGHSLSPKIHKAALRSCGLEGDYSLFLVHPENHQRLKSLLARVRSGELTGLNVTIPHKQNVIPLLDELTPTAKAIGAVNTIFIQKDKLTGDNTDAPGFLADLRRFLTAETWRNRNTNWALVIGAGGAARAVFYSLANSGWKVTVTARCPEQAQDLIAQFPIFDDRLSNIKYHPNAICSLTSDLSLIVNATSVGMSPDIHSSPWPDGLAFPENAFVYDLVYNPRKTKLFKDACNAGLPAATGLGMLVEQAALSFEIWTGHTPPRDALIAAVH